MATIVRIKRRRDVDPADALRVSCKRQRNDQVNGRENEDLTELSECLKFAGTVPSKDVGVSKPVRDAIRKEKLEREYKHHHIDMAADARQRQQHTSRQNRYRVIATRRTINLDNLDEEVGDTGDHINKLQTSGDERTSNTSINSSGNQLSKNTSYSASGSESNVRHNSSDNVVAGASGGPDDVQSVVPASEGREKMFSLYDVEDCTSAQSNSRNGTESGTTSQITCNSMPMVREHVSPRSREDGYVYDLYYSNSREFSFRYLENMLRIEALDEQFMYDDGAGSDSDPQVYDDEDDENEEGNWRNDYPDEDPLFFENGDSDYLYREGFNDEVAFESDVNDELAEWMSARCNIEDGNELSSDEEECIDGFDVPQAGRGSSYDQYYRHVHREMDQYCDTVQNVDTDSDDG